MSASSSSSTREFSVFLSFRGQETRKAFVSHIRSLLDRRGITTLEDENELRGIESANTCVAIGESTVAVVLFSEKYASSPYSLESLVKILKCHHSGSLAVIPIFYEIDPSDVIKQSGRLSESFSVHERDNPVKVKTWRQALSQLADIPGGQYSENWECDAELIRKITDDIWGMLIGSKSFDLCGLVGIDRHMKAMHGLLDLGQTDEIRWIQVVGMGGIGKTELTKYMYDEISHCFDIHLWLDRRKGALNNNHDGDCIQELSSKVSEYRDREQRARVLLVVDNGDAIDLEHFLIKFQSVDILYLFGSGSRVIVITRECRPPPKIALEQEKLEVFLYQFPRLEFSEALQLFSLYVFEQTHPSVGFEELSHRAVKLAGGNPSVIESLGQILSGLDTEEWEIILSGYEKSAVNGILEPTEIILDSSVTDSVSTQLSTSSYSSDLVGMNSRMQAVSVFLELESEKEVRVVGIWGTGGIGKTTLARYAYEEISQQFHTHVFLDNAKENSLPSLEERFLSKAMEREDLATIKSKHDSDIVKSWLQHQKVLLVVDGMDNSKALEDVRKISTWFGPGSRFIVTTRDESLLLANGVKHVHEVKCLRFDEALQLFYHFALKQKSPSDHWEQLSVRAVKLVGFLPLALKVTGSMLYGKDEKYWETVLQSLEEKQDKGILEVVRRE